MGPRPPADTSPARPLTPFDLWRRAMPLGDAVMRFGGAEWAAETRAVLDAFDRVRTDPRHPLHDRGESTDRLQRMAAAWEAQHRALRGLRDALRERLGQGELMALGFVRADGAERLVAVPPERWREAAAVDWDRSSLVGGAPPIADVRVVVPEARRIDAPARARPRRIRS